MEQKVKKDSLANQSSDKMLALIEFMSCLDNPIRLSDLSRNLNMNISTLSRFLTTLVMNGYVAQEQDTGRYYMTYKMCQISNNLTQRRGFRQICSPFLRQISNEFGCTTNLIVLYDDSCIYLDVISSPLQISAPLQRIGKVAPLYCTGAGKLLFQNYTEEMFHEYCSKVKFEAFTEYTVTNEDDLRRLIQKAKINGYAVDNEECEYGTRCLAVPVFDYTNDVAAVISINAPTTLMTDEFIRTNAPVLKRYARDLSAELGYKALEA